MVYVDSIHIMVSRKKAAASVGKRWGHQWCHMWADSIDELITFACNIGLKESWMHKSKLCNHFDVVPSMRKKAIENGAVECSFKTWLINRNHCGMEKPGISLGSISKLKKLTNDERLAYYSCAEELHNIQGS